MIIPMAALDEKVRSAIKQEDGLQNIGGTDIFVYATGRLEEHPHRCCCGGGGGGHHHHHEEGHECCGGGGGHHHHHEEGHECCGGGGGHHNHEEGHECRCSHDEHYDRDEADETFIDEEDNYDGEEEDDDLGTVRVINEPVVIVNTDDVAKLGFAVQDDMFFGLSPEGLTLLPGADVDKDGFQTGAITIRLEEE